MKDSFRLVRRDSPPDSETARRQLEGRTVTDHLTEHDSAAAHYQLDLGLETAVNMALAVGAPLLVTGEPGTGKTQLAYFLGEYFAVPVRPFLVKSTSVAEDLKYEFDAVAYLQSAYAAREGEKAPPRMRFLKKRPLWEAYEAEGTSVLLIDEIDKAPRDFPNDLLHELDQGWFYHPFDLDAEGNPLRVPAERGKPPIVVITSNVERRLPGPFLRRCVFHHIELTETLLRAAVDARVGEFPNLPGEVMERALARFWELRNARLSRSPSTAELLVWLAVLNALGASVEDLSKPAARLPGLGALIKDHDDLQKLKKL